MLTTPPLVASATVRLIVLPVMVAPLAFDVPEIAPTVVTPAPEPPATSPMTRQKPAVLSYIRLRDEPAARLRLAPVPVMMRLVAVEPASLFVIVAAWVAAFTRVSCSPSRPPAIPVIV